MINFCKNCKNNVITKSNNQCPNCNSFLTDVTAVIKNIQSKEDWEKYYLTKSEEFKKSIEKRITNLKELEVTELIRLQNFAKSSFPLKRLGNTLSSLTKILIFIVTFLYFLYIVRIIALLPGFFFYNIILALPFICVGIVNSPIVFGIYLVLLLFALGIFLYGTFVVSYYILKSFWIFITINHKLENWLENENNSSSVNQLAKVCKSICNATNIKSFDYIIDGNCFFIGVIRISKKNVLIIDPKLLSYLNEDEITSLVAHEYGHLRKGLGLAYDFLSRLHYTTKFIEQRFENPESKMFPLVITKLIVLFYRKALKSAESLFSKEYHFAELFADLVAINIGKRDTREKERKRNFVKAFTKVANLQLIYANQDFDTIYDEPSSTHPSIKERLETIDSDTKEIVEEVLSTIPSIRLDYSEIKTKNLMQKNLLQHLARPFL